jgi:urea-proton symporter
MPFANLLGQFQGYMILLGIWALIMLAVLNLFKKKATTSSFLVSERSVGVLLGSLTIAFSWIWAPALFVSSQQAYEQSLPGLFWFTLPNIGAFLLFSFLGARMRNVFNHGFTLPEYMGVRFNDRKMELLYSFAIFVSQVYAVIINLTAALLMLNLVTGIPRQILIVILGVIMLSISLIKGIRSSLVEDSIKAVFIFTVVLIIIPWTISSGGGISAVTGGLGGIKHQEATIFNATIAWAFGLPITISLLSGITIDQQQWQRAFALKKESVRKAYLFGGLIFAIVPITLGLLGFVAANPDLHINVPQNQLAGFSSVIKLLPISGVIIFIAMVLTSLIAAGSSALAAISSIGAVDIFKHLKPNASTQSILKASRASMFILMVVAMLISLIPNIQILYILLVVGVFRASLFIPTILSLFWTKLSKEYTFWGIILGMLTGVPLFVYGSVVKNTTISSFGSLIPIIITVAFCVIGTIIKPNNNFRFKSLSEKD